MSKENLVKYLAREKDKELERKEKYLKAKMEILHQNILTEAEQEKFLGISSTKNYWLRVIMTFYWVRSVIELYIRKNS